MQSTYNNATTKIMGFLVLCAVLIVPQTARRIFPIIMNKEQIPLLVYAFSFILSTLTFYFSSMRFSKKNALNKSCCLFNLCRVLMCA